MSGHTLVETHLARRAEMRDALVARLGLRKAITLDAFGELTHLVTGLHLVCDKLLPEHKPLWEITFPKVIEEAFAVTATVGASQLDLESREGTPNPPRAQGLDEGGRELLHAVREGDARPGEDAGEGDEG